ncbi:MAG: hypothetical protein IPM22_18725 [Betaproteobacteria bacterium]|nr:hypothetical protein [Betaproteobacteria bacterium]
MMVNVIVVLSDGSIVPKLAAFGWLALNVHVWADAAPAHSASAQTSVRRSRLAGAPCRGFVRVPFTRWDGIEKNPAGRRPACGSLGHAAAERFR